MAKDYDGVYVPNEVNKISPDEEVSLLTKIASIGETNPNITFVPTADVKASNRRDNIAFWICGLLNNFGYVVMLSAAFDMLPALSPSVVLAADIIPSLVTQMVAPYFMNRIPYPIRVTIALFLDISSFLICAFFEETGVKLLGVACASIGAGFGEMTFLAYSSHYHKNVVSSWSSGTGGAGILGALSYMGLRYQLSSKSSLIISSPLPLGIAACFFFVLTKPASLPNNVSHSEGSINNLEGNKVAGHTITAHPSTAHKKSKISFNHQLRLLLKLTPFMIPLGLVYFGEYLINQSITPALTYPDDRHFSDPNKSYLWYQSVYQVGVFISRSSVNLLPIKSIFLLQLPAIFQIFNALFLSLVAVYNFIPSIYVIFAIIFWEGLLGGCIYVNTFYLLSQKFEGVEKEFCMGATSQAYGVSITMAALIGIAYEPFLKHHRRI